MDDTFLGLIFGTAVLGAVVAVGTMIFGTSEERHAIAPALMFASFMGFVFYMAYIY